MERIVDEGDWRAIKSGERVDVASTDFLHDVWLTVTGDFSDTDEKFAYAELIAERLNDTRGKL